MLRTTTLACAAILAASVVAADDVTLGALTVEHPRIFEKPQAVKVGGGYMRISNTGGADDALIEVRAPDIPRIELHISQTDDAGVARMIRQDSIPVPAGGSVTLEPGGLHVMFMGLGGMVWEDGDKIDATLVFERAGQIDITFDVEKRSAADHGGMDHSGHSAKE